jgi:vacuolar iron transporter family protein
LADANGELHPHIPARQVADKLVLGGTDGVIESIATTAALNGAGVAFETLLVVGVAFAVAGAISMYFSNYLSRRSELQSLKMDVEREKMEIETEPDEEKREMQELLEKEGYTQKEVNVILQRLTRDKDLWLRAQLQHELNLNISELSTNPLRASAPAGIAFLLAAFLPLLPYAAGVARTPALLSSAGLALLALFLLGSMRYLSLKFFDLRRGLESAAVGGLAAAILFIVGRFISAY